MTHDEIADRLIDWAVNEPRVSALWIEAERLEDLRRPFPSLRLHLALEEPAYPSLASELAKGLGCLPGAALLSVAETPRFAKEHLFEVAGLRFRLIAEQSHLLAKRPRSEVVSLVDKTCHLLHVLDFSSRGRR